MGKMVFVLLFVSNAFGQTGFITKTDQYTGRIDEQVTRQQLDSLVYPHRSYCGGTVTGFYGSPDTAFVYLRHTFGVEHTHGQQEIYYQRGKIVKIVASRREPDWKKADQDSLFNAYGEPLTKSAYTDSSWVIYFGPEISMTTYSSGAVVSTDANPWKIQQLLYFAAIMTIELRGEDYPWAEPEKNGDD